MRTLPARPLPSAVTCIAVLIVASSNFDTARAGDLLCPPYWSQVGPAIAPAALHVQFRSAVVADLGEGPELCVAGAIQESASDPTRAQALRWNGVVWRSFPPLPAHDAWFATTIDVVDRPQGQRLVVGAHGSAGPSDAAAFLFVWDGDAWSELVRLRADSRTALVYDVAQWSGTFYVAGLFDTVDSTQQIKALAEHDGEGWAAVGGGLSVASQFPFPVPIAAAMTPQVENGVESLYAAGYFDRVAGTPCVNVARWDGAAWSPVGALPFASVIPPVLALPALDVGSGPQLFAAGRFGNRKLLAMLNGTTWEYIDVPALSTEPHVRAHSLAVYDDGRGPALFVGGLIGDPYNDTSPFRCVARRDGESWDPLAGGLRIGNGDDGVNGFVEWVDRFGHALVAVGDFTHTADGRPARAVAQWRCIRGDLNCDGRLNNFDIDPFVLALSDPAAYAARDPHCNLLVGDMDVNGILDNFDIDGFVAALAAF